MEPWVSSLISSHKTHTPSGTEISQLQRSGWDLQVPDCTAGMLLSCLFRCISPLPSSNRFFFFFKLAELSPQECFGGCFAGWQHKACSECPRHLPSACCKRKGQSLVSWAHLTSFWSRRKGPKILVDRSYKVCMLNVQVYVVLYIYIFSCESGIAPVYGLRVNYYGWKSTK